MPEIDTHTRTETPRSADTSRARRQRDTVAVLPTATNPERAGAHEPRAPHDPARSDPMTEWLLERSELDETEFSVLFAVHKLGARVRARGWISRSDLQRSTNLNSAQLTATLHALAERGFLGARRHPQKTDWARYRLIVQ